jgi:hypothetical protein
VGCALLILRKGLSQEGFNLHDVLGSNVRVVLQSLHSLFKYFWSRFLCVFAGLSRNLSFLYSLEYVRNLLLLTRSRTPQRQLKVVVAVGPRGIVS